MVVFDKEIVEDPLDELEGITAINKERTGPITDSLNNYIQATSGSSYHNTDPNRGHLSASDGCKRRSYLNYVHKLDDELEPPELDVNSRWTFKHGDLIHEEIQEKYLELFGEDCVTVEETVRFDLEDDFYIYGHADLVLRDLDTPEKVKAAIPDSVTWEELGKPVFPSPFVIDIKTKSEFKYYAYHKNGHARTVPSDSNMMQLNGYMGILGADIGALMYYSKRNDHIEEYMMNFDEELFKEARANIVEVLDDVKNGNPSARDAKKYLCKADFCRYYREGLCPGCDDVSAPDNYNPDNVDFSYDNPSWDSK